jgi:hypothetical protein
MLEQAACGSARIQMPSVNEEFLQASSRIAAVRPLRTMTASPRNESTKSVPSAGPLLSVRSAVVLLTAIVIGITAGVLSYLSSHDVPGAVLVGGGGAGAAIILFHTLLGR